MGPFFYNSEMRRILAGMARGKLALEVGVGSGYTSSELESRMRVIGLDLSLDMLRRARKRLANAELVRGDAENLPFEDEVFDSVLSAGLFEYLPNPAKAAREMARVAKRDGAVLALSPRLPDCLPLRIVGALLAVYRRDEVRRIWRAAGLEASVFEAGPRRTMARLAIIAKGIKKSESVEA